jgi:hypothetical protein
MPTTMAWRLHVVAGDDRAAAKVAARVGDLLDGRLVVERIEPYWKIKEHRIVSAALALRATSLPDAVVEALRLASSVAGGWHVTRPGEARDGSWHFERVRISELPRRGRCLRHLGVLAALGTGVASAGLRRTRQQARGLRLSLSTISCVSPMLSAALAR